MATVVSVEQRLLELSFPSANERKRLPTPTKRRLAYIPPQRTSLWACKETTPSHLKLASCGESSFRSFFFAGALSPRDRVAPLQRTSPIGALDEGGGLGGPFRRRQALHGITSIRPSVRWFRPNRQFLPDPFHSTPFHSIGDNVHANKAKRRYVPPSKPLQGSEEEKEGPPTSQQPFEECRKRSDFLKQVDAERLE